MNQISKNAVFSKHVSPADTQATAGGKATHSVVPAHGPNAIGGWELNVKTETKLTTKKDKIWENI